MSLIGIDLPNPVRVSTTSYAHFRKIRPAGGVARNLLRGGFKQENLHLCRVMQDGVRPSWKTWAREFWELDESTQGKGSTA
jgi:hypothetical protein